MTSLCMFSLIILPKMSHEKHQYLARKAKAEYRLPTKYNAVLKDRPYIAWREGSPLVHSIRLKVENLYAEDIDK